MPVDGVTRERVNFIHRIESRLSQDMAPLETNNIDSSANITAIKSAIFDNESLEGKKLLNMIETICHWICNCLDSSKLCNAEDFLALFPLVSLYFDTI